MDPEYRRIDLQSPADLLYLQSNIKTAAQQKLDLAIPPQGEEDAFRSKVQDLVQEVCTDICFRSFPSLLPIFPFTTVAYVQSLSASHSWKEPKTL